MKIAVIAPGKSPTLELVIEENLAYLEDKGYINGFKIFFEDTEIRLSELNMYDIFVFVRNNSLKSVLIHDTLKKSGKSTIFYIDDYLLAVPHHSQVAEDSNRKAEEIYLHLVLARKIVVSTKALLQALGFPSKTVVIPATFNIRKLSLADTSNTRLQALQSALQIVIVQSDAVILNSIEKDELRRAVGEVSRTKRVHVNVFGQCDLFESAPFEVTHWPFMEFYVLQNILNTSSFHLGIAPLTAVEAQNQERLFVDCKNAIKYLNFGFACIPAVYSTSYKHKIADHSNLQFSDNTYESWLNSIQHTITHAKEHIESADKLRQLLIEKYDIAFSAKLFIQVFNSIEK